MNTTCRLCGKRGKLCRSHIIPEFNYAACYDPIHRFYRASTKGPEQLKQVQKGFRERLLCKACETRLSGWESYAKQILCDGGLSLIECTPQGFVLGGADYSRFRLYGLSLIWRMGVSSLDFFSQVALGVHEQPIRTALNANDPLIPSAYPFMLAAVMIDGRFRTDYITPPSLIRDGGHHIYRMVIAGMLYSFCISSHAADPEFQEISITRSGELRIPIFSLNDVGFLREHMREIAAALKKTI